MKKTLMIAGALATTLLVGCSKPVNVEQTSYGFQVNGSTGEVNWSELHQNKNMKLSTRCYNSCDKGYIFKMPVAKVTYDDGYTIPKSNKLELTLGSTLILEFNREGGESLVIQRLKRISENYQPIVDGDAGDNQTFYWMLPKVAEYDIPESKFKSIVRTILSDYEIIEAHDNIAAMGSIAQDIEDAVRQHLLDIGSSLKLKRVEFHQVSLPDDVKEKYEEEYNLDAKERIQQRQLSMTRKRVKERHLLNLEELENDIELLSYMQPLLSSNVLAYKWIQTANAFAEAGIPFAVEPEMITPAVGEIADKSFDLTRFKKTLEQKKADLQDQINAENEQ